MWLKFLKNNVKQLNCLSIGLSCIAVGLANLMPPSIVYLLSPQYVFNYMARQFDSDLTTKENDGAFIAGLLDTNGVLLKQPYWIKKVNNDDSIEWIEGIVFEVEDTRFAVQKKLQQNIIMPRISVQVMPENFESDGSEDDSALWIETNGDMLSAKELLQMIQHFWFDKVCIEQSNIGSGLKVLPINIMACENMVLLCGSTYVGRLWCVW
jgi:hypothetical protein